MIPEVKLIFDECLSHLTMESLRPFLIRAGQELFMKSVVVEYQKKGVPDKVWIPEIAAGDGWIVITADNGKKNKNEAADEKLPFLCRHHRVTHIIMSSSVHALKGWDKGQAIVSVWTDIVAATTKTRGTRFRLCHNQAKTGFHLIDWDEREAEIRAKKKGKGKEGSGG